MITSSSSGNGLMHSDSLRLTDDDRVSAFVIYASLLSRSRRLKEANKILAEAIGSGLGIINMTSDSIIVASSFDTSADITF